MTGGRALLLDTHIAIWLADNTLDSSTLATIDRAAKGDGVFLSPVTAWEIGLLSRMRPGRAPRYDFLPDPISWYRRFASHPLIQTATLTAEIALASSLLPGSLHDDPADRMLAATARALNIALMTRDARLIDYGRAGHMKVLPV